MKLTLEIALDNAAFNVDDELSLADEITSVLAMVGPRIAMGDSEHWLRDVNGNKIGSWQITDTKHASD